MGFLLHRDIIYVILSHKVLTPRDPFKVLSLNTLNAIQARRLCSEMSFQNILGLCKILNRKMLAISELNDCSCTLWKKSAPVNRLRNDQMWWYHTINSRINRDAGRDTNTASLGLTRSLDERVIMFHKLNIPLNLSTGSLFRYHLWIILKIWTKLDFKIN